MAPEKYTPSGRGPQLIAVFAFFMALTTVTFLLRAYVRTRLVKAFGLDDWFAAAGWLLFNIHGSFAIAGAYHGTGQHTDLIKPPSNIAIGLRWWWLCEPLYVASNMCVKLSIALMLLRFVMQPSHRMMIYIVTIILELYSVAFFFLFIFQCTAPSYFWTRLQGNTNGHCMSPDITITAVYVYSGIAIIYDWTMAIVPWFVVRKLQMNLRTKLMCAFILALGSIASIATIIRIPYISSLTNISDFLYSTVDVAIWSCSETGISITASCAATLKPLFNKFFASGGRYSGNGGSTTRISPIPLSFEEGFRNRALAGKSRKYVRTRDVDEDGDADGSEESNSTGMKTVTVREGSRDGDVDPDLEFGFETGRARTGTDMSHLSEQVVQQERSV